MSVGSVFSHSESTCFGGSSSDRFRPILGPTTGRVQQHLTAVRDIRNKVMHFRAPADAAELERLKEARNYIDVKLQRAQSVRLGTAS